MSILLTVHLYMYHAHWTGKAEFEDTKELINPRRVDNSKRKRTKNNPQNTTQKLKLKIEQHEPGVNKFKNNFFLQ